MTYPCPNPHFEYNPVRGCWEACTACGRLAWDHEQSDPAADMQNMIQELTNGRPSSPPAMRPGTPEC